MGRCWLGEPRHGDGEDGRDGAQPVDRSALGSAQSPDERLAGFCWPDSSAILIGLTLLAAGLFFFSAQRLNPLCWRLSPIAFLLLAIYPRLKRFTWACHFGLGLVLACAPVAGWLAVTGRWDPIVLPLAVGVLSWVAGFDILYALLDLDFDRGHGVYSIPGTFGVETALVLSRLCHALAAVGFGSFGLKAGLGGWFWTGWAIVVALLIYEHGLARPATFHRINRAFFTVNGWVSISLFVFTVLDLKGAP